MIVRRLKFAHKCVTFAHKIAHLMPGLHLRKQSQLGKHKTVDRLFAQLQRFR